jgi:signal transduction histidine kinase
MVMRRVSNLLLTTRALGLAFPRETDGQIRGALTEEGDAIALDVDAINGREMVCDASRLVDDLAHDLRQPLSSMRLNLQSAIRCLRFREPSVAPALEALTECLDVEGELVTLVARLQQQLLEAILDSHWFSLNDLARDTCATLVALGYGPRRVAQRLADPPPYVSGVDVLALHKGVLGIMRRLFARADRNGSSFDAACLVIETRRTTEQAELRLAGIPCGDMPDDIESILQGAGDGAGLSRAEASIDFGPTTAAIVISFPAWTLSRHRGVRRPSDGA